MAPRHRRLAAPLALAVLLPLAACDSTSSGEGETEPLGGPVPTDPPETETASGGPAATSTPAIDDTDDETGAGDPLSQPPDVSVGEPVATGLQSPWDVAFLEDGSALVPLRDTGHIVRIGADGGVTPLDAGGPDGAVPDVHHDTEDGLLGLTIGPDGGVYVYLTTPDDNRVLRYDLTGDQLVDQEVVIDGIPSHTHHSGGRIAFGPDGYLYITTGDIRETELAQDTDSLAGKILRVTPTGEPAPGNPFDNEVWSYGHRNVQGLGWTSDGRLYASEFGSSHFDELNLIEPGANYGWPYVEGWVGDGEYTDPLVTWSTDEASPSGIAVTDQGVWMTGLRGERLWWIPIGEGAAVGEPQDYDLDLGRLRAVEVAPTGEVWLVTSNTDGRGEPSEDDDQVVRLKVG